MIRLQFTFFLILLIPKIVCSQEKGKLSIDFEYNSQQFEMSRVNDYLLDTNYFSSYLFQAKETNQIERGNAFDFSVSYQPLSFIDFGIYGSFQYGKVTRTPYFYEDLDPLWNPGQNLITHEGIYSLEAKSFFVGVKTTLYINKLLRFDEKNVKFLNHLLLGVDLKGGYGLANLKERYSFSSAPLEFGLKNYESQNFQGKIGLKLGYILTKESIFSAIGLNFGYQVFKTPVVKNSVNQELSYNNNESSVNLDFSGLYFGAFLTIGK